ncbi:hypothetical protein EH196_03055 [Bacillus sp. C1-1]|nr:hypothetical protein EH196_03055 [Bacillus sp. C1-1]
MEALRSKLFLSAIMTVLVISTIFTSSFQTAGAQSDLSLEKALEQTYLIEENNDRYFDKMINQVKDQGLEIKNDLSNLKSFSVYGVEESNDVVLTLSFNNVEDEFEMTTAILKDGETLYHFQETKGTYDSENNNGHVLSYLNGTLLVDETFVQDESEVNTMITWAGFTDCMENQGVPGWVITTISIACGVVCAATLGTGCLLCALGVAETWAVQIGICLGEEITNP